MLDGNDVMNSGHENVAGKYRQEEYKSECIMIVLVQTTAKYMRHLISIIRLLFNEQF